MAKLTLRIKPTFRVSFNLLFDRSLRFCQLTRGYKNHLSSPTIPIQSRWSSFSIFRFKPQQSRSGQSLNILNRIPNDTVFYSIIGLNSVVFLMWFLATEQFKQEREPFAIIWMQHNFTNSWKNLTSGRLWTPLTACFSHSDVAHILLNGFTFFFMARPVLQLLGSQRFLVLYLGGGIFASFSSVLYAYWNSKSNYSSHGASGSIYSIISFLACIAPKMTFQLYGIVPVPACIAVGGLFAYDFYSTMQKKTGKTDNIGHLGGLTAGIGYFLYYRFKIL